MHKMPKIYNSYRPAENCFLKNSDGVWCLEKCRETLQKHLEARNQTEFYFCAGTDLHASRVVNFFKIVEAAANVDPEEFIKFEITTDPSVLYVKMSKWWSNQIRQSVLTIFLRCGRYYSVESANGFDSAINSVSYAAETRAAIDLFLSGKTAIKNKAVADGEFKGWCELFSKKGFDPSKILVRKKRKKTPENHDVLGK